MPFDVSDDLVRIWSKKLSVFGNGLLIIFLFSHTILFAKVTDEGYVDAFNIKESLKYADAKLWDKAYVFAKKSNTRLIIDLVDWLRLRSGDGKTTEYLQFLKMSPKYALVYS